jgi:HK97 family phage portal protein
MNIFKSLFRSRDKPPDGFRPKNNLTLSSPQGWSGIFSPTASGKTVNEITSLNVTAVYACCKVIAETIASLPLHVYRNIDSDNKIKATDHPLYNILHLSPNPDMTAYTYLETAVMHLLLWGNSYTQIIRNGLGEVVALYPLLPSKMLVERDGKSGELIYNYTANKGIVKIPRHHILHIPGLSFDGLVGYSPIHIARNAIGLSMAVEDFGSTFFSNGANPSGILSHPGVLKDHDKLRESWRQLFSGGNAHSIAVLEENMKYQQISIPPNDLQFLESRRFQIEEISRIFRVPLHLVGDLSGATFSNIEHQSLSFVKFTIAPWLTKLEQAFQRSLLLPFEQPDMFVRFLVDGLLRGDYPSRMQGYSVGIQNGFLSPNDVRRLENMNLIEDESGDKFYFNGNMIPIDLAAKAVNYGGVPEGGDDTSEKP